MSWFSFWNCLLLDIRKSSQIFDGFRQVSGLNCSNKSNIQTFELIWTVSVRFVWAKFLKERFFLFSFSFSTTKGVAVFSKYLNAGWSNEKNHRDQIYRDKRKFSENTTLNLPVTIAAITRMRMVINRNISNSYVQFILDKSTSNRPHFTLYALQIIPILATNSHSPLHFIALTKH